MRTIHCVLFMALLAPLAGCSFIADFDRSKIKDDKATDAGHDSGAVEPGKDASTKDAATGGDAMASNDAAATHDAGSDAAMSSEMDSGTDAATASDAAADGGNDAGDDAGLDASIDSGMDADVDAGMDAGPPECDFPADCGGNSSCTVRTCIKHKCGTMNLNIGATALFNQVAGNCKLLVCTAGGGTTTINDDTDVKSDGKVCTADTCSGGNEVHTPLTGTSCSGTGMCNSAGDCVGCLSPSDCPGVDDNCQTRTCSGAGVCGFSFTSSGTATTTTPVQTAGNCKKFVCDGSGGSTEVDDDTDEMSDSKECTVDTCSNGSNVHTPQTGMVCTQGGGKFCSSTGNCVECATANNCTGTDDNCKMRTCSGAGACGVSFTSVGMATTTNPVQVSGDCQKVECNGSGGTMSVADNSDLPGTDGNQCTSETCNMGTPEHPTKTLGATCTQNMGAHCNAAAMCVDCTQDSHCSPMICIDQECIATGSLSAESVTPASFVAGATGNVVVAFTTTGKWAANGTLTIVFPAGFNITNAAFVSMTGATGTATVVDASQQLTLTRTTGATTANAGAISITLSNIKNPGVSGSTGTFAIDTRTSAGIAIDTDTAPAVTITAGALAAASVVLVDSTADAMDLATVSITTTNTWPADGTIDIDFPAGFVLTAATLGPVTGAGAGTFGINISAQTLTLSHLTGGTAILGGATLVIPVNDVKNPSVPGTTASYVITTRAASSAAIDTDTAPGSTIN